MQTIRFTREIPPDDGIANGDFHHRQFQTAALVATLRAQGALPPQAAFSSKMTRSR